MKTRKYLYILFPSYNDGLALESILKTKFISYTIVPTPRDLSKCCGISMKVEDKDVESIKDIVDGNPNISIEGIFELKKPRKSLFGSL
ncbi:DUF3343 domain-containing protein [Sporosalibacterium faouarense]|uniref:DUF3343 domain-containing protein n=1 Tax=Sporosalibacterium faouarense TaxID=516123 RepID=UPI00141D558B|nr:DUF3343 domain-containing protein [Sporosalibacterium faouarense]MTI46309.1 DUF3343 domain-containing protein [Bacillota bacterium]